jgi:hypothetical protein
MTISYLLGLCADTGAFGLARKCGLWGRTHARLACALKLDSCLGGGLSSGQKKSRRVRPGATLSDEQFLSFSIRRRQAAI